MKVKELIEKLQSYNQDAKVTGVFDYKGYPLLSIGVSGGDGCTKENCDEATFHFTLDDSETVGVKESPSKTFPNVNQFEVGASYRR